MNKIIRKIKKMFCKSGQVYNVNIKDIIISEEFRATHPRFKKMVQKREFYRKNNMYESQVILNRDFMLIDGYTTYLLCLENGEKYVDVYFMD